ncbi:PEP-CTERM sorting domain-containing protein [Undibacterium terreum]|uniref:PEP-CTERM protein-sorting domain-containing protein n=1 Tax=Undibacterium terreum TaxID=1224302 RepID=A0A916XD71_9BURK|nr:PEP-CTERM sorting domain-containing protein [Undibacterium terreum]GGC65296.1 hypothetical protein GCM10011396_10360 [Undibacterium terreum]
MKVGRLVLFVLAAFFVMPAIANVTYTWHTTSTSPSVSSFQSQIVVSDYAFFQHSASIDWEKPGDCNICSNAPDNGILSISVSVNGALGETRHPGAAGGLFDHISLFFYDSGYLGGSVNINTEFVELISVGGPGGWGVTKIQGDPFGAAGCSEKSCGGVSGYYFADTLPVPEPMPLFLILLGGVAIVSIRKRKIMSNAVSY